jgi:radical SAM-linked protein
MKAMNKVLPQGIRITGAVRRYKNSNIMALVRKADYDIEAYSNGEHTIEEVKSSIGRLMERNAIMVKKKEKDGGYKEIDIRPMIKNLEAHRLPKKAPGYEEFRSAFLLKASVDAGSKSNLNPVMIVSALPEYAGINIDASRIHRTALYVESCGGLADPMKDALNEVPAGVCRKGEKGVAAG